MPASNGLLRVAGILAFGGLVAVLMAFAVKRVPSDSRTPVVVTAIMDDLEKAQKAFEEGRYDAAMQAAQKVLDVEPDNGLARQIHDRSAAQIKGEAGPPTPAQATRTGTDWVKTAVAEVGATFEHPPWPERQTPINSEGYHAIRRRWTAPGDESLYVAVDYAPDAGGPNDGWAGLDARFRRNCPGRYQCLALDSHTQNGADFERWEYCLTSKSGHTEHVYKLGGTHNGFDVAVWGGCLASAWESHGDLIRAVVGTFLFVTKARG
jgi:hypothetical protein